ncbi:hypothetical protein [Zavarzinia sp. CC-PAN008]|uniref:hypothetical protein n=1 Tax=Zavarzinia sp. CC-PAN008 TaxID=3243332 RepID=UPI003F749BA7
MKAVLMAFGVVAILVGGLWIGQGTGMIRWPETSFMIDQSPWIWYGAAVVAVGLAAIFVGSRRRR